MRGVSCPGPILEARKLLDGMKAGEVLQLVSDCPGSADDVVSWAKAGAAELLFSHETGKRNSRIFPEEKLMAYTINGVEKDTDDDGYLLEADFSEEAVEAIAAEQGVA
jgi:TusA-related sulfurtransferase